MQTEALAPVPRQALKQHVRRSLQRYWPTNADLLDGLAVAELDFPIDVQSLRLVDVRLPPWAAQFGVDGCLAVPSEACPEPAGWESVDWWLAAFLMLEGWHERAWEQSFGSIHSYSFRLKGSDPRLWEHAWVNRIALFLRAWAARHARQDSMAAFGPLPAPEIVVTHDVDAVAKTWAIRVKQGAFLGFNALRLALLARPGQAWARLAQAFRFMLGNEDWWKFDLLLDAERRAGVRGVFNFYADGRGKTARRWLFDPGYDIEDPRLRELLSRLAGEGCGIGLHQSHDAWQSAGLMQAQRERLQSVTAVPVTSCRQHWLRFSWHDTWAAQSAAGFERDLTLMFNDRPGLRTAAAISWAPWNPQLGHAHGVSALPTLLMDSHFYDYAPMNPQQRRAALRRWLGEVAAVGGQAAVLWHPHTLTRDYGWSEGFEELMLELSQPD
jgi:hypothetical protein